MEKHSVKFIPNAGLGNQLYFFTYCNYLREVLNKEVSLLVFGDKNMMQGDTSDKQVRNPLLSIASSLGIPIKIASRNWEHFYWKYKKLPFYNSFFKKFIHIIDEEKWGLFYDFEGKKSGLLNVHVGYYQAHQYLTDNFKKILKKEIEKIAPASKYEISKNDVAVHIRRGDFKKFPEVFNLIDIDYYKNALNCIEEKVKIEKVYIFSDNFDEILEEINWIKQKYEVVLVENQSVLQDFGLLMRFSNYAIGNSTFAWWAAKLSNNEKPMVVVPKTPIKVMVPESSPYSEEWIVLDN